MDANYLPTSEYARAMGTLRAGKNVFWWLIVLSVLAQLAAFVAVAFFSVLDAAYVGPTTEPAAPAAVVADSAADKATAAMNEASEAVERVISPDAPTGLPATMPAEVAVEPVVSDEGAQPARRDAATWQFGMKWGLAVTKFLAFVSTLILVVVVVYHLQVSLVGRLGGAGGFARAMMWSLVLLAMMTPWQQVFDRSLVVGAMFNIGDLESQTNMVRTQWGAPQPTLSMQIVYFTRFMGYPIVAFLVALMLQWRLRQAYRAMVLPVEPS